MVARTEDSDFAMIWMRRVTYYLLGVTGATGTCIMLLGAFLMVSGVLEW